MDIGHPNLTVTNEITISRGREEGYNFLELNPWCFLNCGLGPGAFSDRVPAVRTDLVSLRPTGMGLLGKCN